MQYNNFLNLLQDVYKEVNIDECIITGRTRPIFGISWSFQNFINLHTKEYILNDVVIMTQFSHEYKVLLPTLYKLTENYSNYNNTGFLTIFTNKQFEIEIKKLLKLKAFL